MKCSRCKKIEEPKRYKCAVCKKDTATSNAYFHHFTDKMNPRYQCIKCRFVTPEAIAAAREESKKFRKQIRFLQSLTKKVEKANA